MTRSVANGNADDMVELSVVDCRKMPVVTVYGEAHRAKAEIESTPVVLSEWRRECPPT